MRKRQPEDAEGRRSRPTDSWLDVRSDQGERGKWRPSASTKRQVPRATPYSRHTRVWCTAPCFPRKATGGRALSIGTGVLALEHLPQNFEQAARPFLEPLDLIDEIRHLALGEGTSRRHSQIMPRCGPNGYGGQKMATLTPDAIVLGRRIADEKASTVVIWDPLASEVLAVSACSSPDTCIRCVSRPDADRETAAACQGEPERRGFREFSPTRWRREGTADEEWSPAPSEWPSRARPCPELLLALGLLPQRARRK